MKYLSTGYQVLPMSENQIVNQNQCMLPSCTTLQFRHSKGTKCYNNHDLYIHFFPTDSMHKYQEDVCLKAHGDDRSDIL